MNNKLCDSCKKQIIFLKNAKTEKFVPVDYSSLTTDELTVMNVSPNVELLFNGVHHISHYKTCDNPNRFSKRGKK